MLHKTQCESITVRDKYINKTCLKKIYTGNNGIQLSIRIKLLEVSNRTPFTSFMCICFNFQSVQVFVPTTVFTQGSRFSFSLFSVSLKMCAATPSKQSEWRRWVKITFLKLTETCYVTECNERRAP